MRQKASPLNIVVHWMSDTESICSSSTRYNSTSGSPVTSEEESPDQSADTYQSSEFDVAPMMYELFQDDGVNVVQALLATKRAIDAQTEAVDKMCQECRRFIELQLMLVDRLATRS